MVFLFFSSGSPVSGSGRSGSLSCQREVSCLAYLLFSLRDRGSSWLKGWLVVEFVSMVDEDPAISSVGLSRVGFVAMLAARVFAGSLVELAPVDGGV